MARHGEGAASVSIGLSASEEVTVAAFDEASGGLILTAGASRGGRDLLDVLQQLS